MGKKPTVFSGAGEIHFTVRSDSNAKMRTIETTLEHIAHEVADEYRLKCDIKWTQGFQANENDEMAVRLIKTAVKENQFELMEKTILYLGEDFGLFTQHYPGAMFGLGSGTDSPALHNPDYDFPDDIITTEYLFSPYK
jgi:metal-dependent amidase/aminoacylase/carboxypeptidase family protein